MIDITALAFCFFYETGSGSLLMQIKASVKVNTRKQQHLEDGYTIGLNIFYGTTLYLSYRDKHVEAIICTILC